MEGSELFRHAENWLNENPGKTLREYKTETGYTGQALKTRQRKGDPVRVSYKGKSSESQTRRVAAEKPKTFDEAAAVRRIKQIAREQSQSTLHQQAAEGRPSIAEHDVRLASGGTNEHMSISDPDFKVFKDTLEQKTSRMFGDKYVVDIDEISGYPRVVESKYHNKFQPVSRQPGLTIEPGMDIDSSLTKLQQRSLMRMVTSKGGIHFGGPKLMGVMPAILEFIPAIDELTGEHIDKTLKKGVNVVRTSLGFPANPN